MDTAIYTYIREYVYIYIYIVQKKNIYVYYRRTSIIQKKKYNIQEEYRRYQKSISPPTPTTMGDSTRVILRKIRQYGTESTQTLVNSSAGGGITKDSSQLAGTATAQRCCIAAPLQPFASFQGGTAKDSLQLTGTTSKQSVLLSKQDSYGKM